MKPIILVAAILYIVFGTSFIKDLWDCIAHFFTKKITPIDEPLNYPNTPESQKKWWDGLNEEWRKIFRFQVYQKIDIDGRDIADYILNAEHLELNLKDINNLSGLRHLQKLQSLVITNYKSTDLNTLRFLGSLHTLHIYNGDLSTGIPITALFNFCELILIDCKIKDITPFKNFSNLQVLHLDVNDIQDINAVKQFKKIKHLSLQNNPISDFSPLTHLSNTKIELSFNQKYNLQELHKNNIRVDIAFTNTYHPYDKTFFQNN